MVAKYTQAQEADTHQHQHDAYNCDRETLVKPLELSTLRDYLVLNSLN